MKKFQVLCVDAPWLFSDSLSMDKVPRGAAANYPLLNTEELKKLAIKEIADPDGCILALWVPSSLLQDGLDVMKAWGFQQKQTYIWVKTKKEPLANLIKDIVDLLKIKDAGDKKSQKLWKVSLTSILKNFSLFDILSFYMGRLFRQTHEICLIGINNNKIYKQLKNKSQRSVSFGENLKHSAKPEHLQDSLDIMFPNANKMEIFARRIRANWTCLGNEVCNGEDIRDSLKKFL